MLRTLLGTVLVLGALAGCSSRMGECESDGDCQKFGEQAFCEATTKQCFMRGVDDAGMDGGVVEPEVDGGQCQFQCAEFEACTATGCVGRYSAVSFVTPANGAVFDAGTAVVTLTARLEKAPGYASTTTFPSTLNFFVGPADGGSGVGFSAVTSPGDGTYTTEWTPPAGEADYVLTAAYPAPNGPSGTVSVRVDTVAPSLTVTVPTPQPAAQGGGFTFADPSGPAFRRDETVVVTVESSATDLDPGSVRLAVRGVPSGDFTSLTQVDCASAPFCKQVSVPLSQPPLEALRGEFTFQASALDRAGNLVSSSRPIPVTRWKWSFEGGLGAIKASPAIGEQGTVYFGTSNIPTNYTGKVFALNPEGTKRWESSLTSVVSLSVGAKPAAGLEQVYVSTNTSTNRVALYAIPADGTTPLRCPSSGGYNGQVVGAVAVMDTSVLGVGPVESGLMLINNAPNSRLYAVRPTAPSGDECAPSSSTTGLPAMNTGGSLVATGGTFSYPTDSATLVSYAFPGDNPRWTATTGGQSLSSLAVTGTTLVAGGGLAYNQGGLYSVPTDASGAVTATQLPTTNGAQVSSLVLGASTPASATAVYYGASTASTQGDLRRYELATSTVTAGVQSVGLFQQVTPVLGAGGTLYTATSTSDVLSVYDASTLRARWSAELGGVASSASPALDCARTPAGAPVAGSLGVLYVPAGGALYALIVDSRGLDTTAPWPKYQHDARNSGNPATPITSCPQ